MLSSEEEIPSGSNPTAGCHLPKSGAFPGSGLFMFGGSGWLLVLGSGWLSSIRIVSSKMIGDPLLRIREVWAPFIRPGRPKHCTPARVFRPGAECSSTNLDKSRMPDSRAGLRIAWSALPDPAWLSGAGPALPEPGLAPSGLRPWVRIPALGPESGPEHPVLV